MSDKNFRTAESLYKQEKESRKYQKSKIRGKPCPLRRKEDKACIPSIEGRKAGIFYCDYYKDYTKCHIYIREMKKNDV